MLTRAKTGSLRGHRKSFGLRTGLELRVCKPNVLSASLTRNLKRKSWLQDYRLAPVAGSKRAVVFGDQLFCQKGGGSIGPLQNGRRQISEVVVRLRCRRCLAVSHPMPAETDPPHLPKFITSSSRLRIGFATIVARMSCALLEHLALDQWVVSTCPPAGRSLLSDRSARARSSRSQTWRPSNGANKEAPLRSLKIRRAAGNRTRHWYRAGRSS
jgi:hypothetical protein